MASRFAYRRDAVNDVQASAVTARTAPSRLVVSRTRITPSTLAERARVRETIQALTLRYQRLTEEFDRRAAAQWRAAQRKEEAR